MDAPEGAAHGPNSTGSLSARMIRPLPLLNSQLTSSKNDTMPSMWHHPSRRIAIHFLALRLHLTFNILDDVMESLPNSILFWNMDLSFLSQMLLPAPPLIHTVRYTVVYESKGIIYDRKRCNNGEMTMDPPVLL